MKNVIRIIDINAHITNIQSQIVADKGAKKALLRFDNLGYGVITAVKFKVRAYNDFGDVVPVNGKKSFFLVVQDINVPENMSLADIEVELPDLDIRKLDVEESQVRYSDGRVLNYNGEHKIKFVLEEFSAEEQETLNALRDVFDSRVTYKPLESPYGWICTCGRFNVIENNTCSLCHHTKQSVKEALSEEGQKMAVKNKTDLDQARSIALKAEEKASDRKEKKKRRRNRLAVGLAILLVLLVFALSASYSWTKERAEKIIVGTWEIYKLFENGQEVTASEEDISTDISLGIADDHTGKAYIAGGLITSDFEWNFAGKDIEGNIKYQFCVNGGQIVGQETDNSAERTVEILKPSEEEIRNGELYLPMEVADDTVNGSVILKKTSDVPKEDTGPVLDLDSFLTDIEESLEPTMGKQNALNRAFDYLESIPFSYTGLIDQLEYEGFSTDEATYAADNCGADWNEQAALKARQYMENLSLSRVELIEQLEYEGFTPAQATYGATQNGY